MTTEVNMTLEKVRSKAEKRIGMQAYNKTHEKLSGQPGRVVNYKIESTGDEDMPYAIEYVLAFKSGEEIHSHEKDTVIMLGSKK